MPLKIKESETTYDELKREIQAAPQTYLPSLVLIVLEACRKKKVFKSDGHMLTFIKNRLGITEEEKSAPIKPPLGSFAAQLLEKFKQENEIKTKDYGDGEWVAIRRESVVFAPTELQAVRKLCKQNGFLCSL